MKIKGCFEVAHADKWPLHKSLTVNVALFV